MENKNKFIFLFNTNITAMQNIDGSFESAS